MIVGLLLAASGALQFVSQQHGGVQRRSVTPVCLTKEEVFAKLNEVPVFAIANGAEQLLASGSEGSEAITFFIDIDEAQATLSAVRAAHSDAKLSVAPLGIAFLQALNAQAANVPVRLQPSQAEYCSMRESLGFPAAEETGDASGSPQLIPLFYSEKLTFEDPDGGVLAPLFFGVDCLRAAWVASGQSADNLPGLLLTDLRTLAYDMEHDTPSDAKWRSMVLIPPETSMNFVRANDV